MYKQNSEMFLEFYLQQPLVRKKLLRNSIFYTKMLGGQSI